MLGFVYQIDQEYVSPSKRSGGRVPNWDDFYLLVLIQEANVEHLKNLCKEYVEAYRERGELIMDDPPADPDIMNAHAKHFKEADETFNKTKKAYFDEINKYERYVLKKEDMEVELKVGDTVSLEDIQNKIYLEPRALIEQRRVEAPDLSIVLSAKNQQPVLDDECMIDEKYKSLLAKMQKQINQLLATENLDLVLPILRIWQAEDLEGAVNGKRNVFDELELALKEHKTDPKMQRKDVVIALAKIVDFYSKKLQTNDYLSVKLKNTLDAFHHLYDLAQWWKGRIENTDQNVSPEQVDFGTTIIETMTRIHIILNRELRVYTKAAIAKVTVDQLRQIWTEDRISLAVTKLNEEYVVLKNSKT